MSAMNPIIIEKNKRLFQSLYALRDKHADSGNMMSDEKAKSLMTDAKSGDNDSYHSVLEAHYFLAIYPAVNMGTEDFVADYIQEGNLMLFRRAIKYNPDHQKGTFAGYARRIMTNAMYEHFRYLQKQNFLSLEGLAQEGEGFSDRLIFEASQKGFPSWFNEARIPYQISSEHEERERLRREVQMLREPYGGVLRMAFDGRTSNEIAAVQGISQNTAKTRYYRGLSTLRNELLAKGWAE